MFWRKKYDAFISYSHKDSSVVKPLIELLSLNDRRVFWDEQLSPGDRWDQVIQASVKESNIFVLFWCCDTRESSYTAKEIGLALKLKKKIVPVKLCHAAMPDLLEQWQWIDLQHRVSHECTSVDHLILAGRELQARPVSRRLASPRRMVPIMVGIVFLVVGLSVVELTRHVSRPTAISKEILDEAPASAEIVLTDPTKAVHLRDGYAMAFPPEEGRDGEILEFDANRKLVKRFDIPAHGPKPPTIEFHEYEIPWWYAERAALRTGFYFALAVAFFAWLIWTARKRTVQTLALTRNYLEHVAKSSSG